MVADTPGDLQRQSLLESAASAFQLGFNGVIMITIADGGAPIMIDGREVSCVINDGPFENDTAPSLHWKAKAETLLQIFTRNNALESAYLSGRLIVAGDMSVMARLQLTATHH